MMLRRAPSADLAPFVKTIWLSDDTLAMPLQHGPLREFALPTGHTHLAIRLSDDRLRLFDHPDDAVGRLLSHAVVGGARASHYVRDVSKPVHAVGAQLLPGATRALFGVPEDALAGRHTALDDLLGPTVVATMRARLFEARTPTERLCLFEAMLRARVREACAIHPAVAHALARLEETSSIAMVAAESGYSHRRFIALFRGAVGLTPKVFVRVQRFERALALRKREPSIGWATLATSMGYADQAHFTRDFREFAGLTPSYYARAAPVHAHHVPVAQIGPEVNSVQEPRSGGGYRRTRS